MGEGRHPGEIGVSLDPSSRAEALNVLGDEIDEALRILIGPSDGLPSQPRGGEAIGAPWTPGGYYERLAAEAPAHRCRPPGWWARRRDHVKDGAIWRCACGRRYEFRPGRLVLKGVHQAGQGLAPWWHIFEVAKPPRSA